MANKKSKEALSQIKNEAASAVGVTLKQGYNGDLTSPRLRGVLFCVRKCYLHTNFSC